jgi:uncharacterized protein (UPF0262 family)
VNTGADPDRERIARVVLDEARNIRLSPQLENERRQALFDLLEDNRFALIGFRHGPYGLALTCDGDRLAFTVTDQEEQPITRFTLPLASMRRVVKDYFLICDSYLSAIKTLPPSRIEAIDMGRRGVHDEGAELLRECLATYVSMDKNTARRLFTLIVVLHIRN